MLQFDSCIGDLELLLITRKNTYFLGIASQITPKYKITKPARTTCYQQVLVSNTEITAILLYYDHHTSKELIPPKDIPSINLLGNVVQTCVIAISNNSIALRLERSKIVHYLAAEECGSIL